MVASQQEEKIALETLPTTVEHEAIEEDAEKETMPAGKCSICLWPVGAPECLHQGGGAAQPALASPI
jgi:hypothetical protein